MSKPKPLRWRRRPDKSRYYYTRPEVHEIRRGKTELGSVHRFNRNGDAAKKDPYYQGRVCFGAQNQETDEFKTLEEAKAATQALVLECEAREAALPPIPQEKLSLLSYCYNTMRMLNDLNDDTVKQIEDTLETLRVSPHRLPKGAIPDEIIKVLSHGGYEDTVSDVVKRIRRKFEVDK